LSGSPMKKLNIAAKLSPVLRDDADTLAFMKKPGTRNSVANSHRSPETVPHSILGGLCEYVTV
jgi:hypothetical protein